MRILLLSRALATAVALCGCAFIVVSAPRASQAVPATAQGESGGVRPSGGEPGAPPSPDFSEQIATAIEIARGHWHREIGAELNGLDTDAELVLSSIMHARFEPYDAWMALRGAALGPNAERLAGIMRERGISYKRDDASYWEGTDTRTKFARIWATPRLRRAEWVKFLPEATMAGFHRSDSEDEAIGYRRVVTYLSLYEWDSRVEITNAFTLGERSGAWLSVWSTFGFVYELLTPEDQKLLEGRVATEPIEVRFVFMFDEDLGRWILVQASAVTGVGRPRLLL